MDSLSVLKEVYDETAEQWKEAMGRLSKAEAVVNDLRFQVRAAEAQAREAVARDEDVSANEKRARELYNGSLARPESLLRKADAWFAEQVETGRKRQEAQRIVEIFKSKLATAQSQLAAAQSDFDKVSSEITKLSDEMQRMRAAAN